MVMMVKHGRREEADVRGDSPAPLLTDETNVEEAIVDVLTAQDESEAGQTTRRIRSRSVPARNSVPGLGLGTDKHSRFRRCDSPQDTKAEQEEKEQVNEKDQVACPLVQVKQQSCIICYGNFTKRHPPIPMPCVVGCNNAPVHAKCICEWVETRRNSSNQINANCPLCRGALKPVQYVHVDPIHLERLVMTDFKRRFCMRPIARAAGVVRAYVRVIREVTVLGLRNTFYEMYIQSENKMRYPNGPLPPTDNITGNDYKIMVAKPRKILGASRLGSTKIDMFFHDHEVDIDRHDPNYIGTVKGSVLGVSHSILAVPPNETNIIRRRGTLSRSRPRVNEIGAVRYTQNRIGRNVGPRRMQVALPKVSLDSRQTIVNSNSASSSFMASVSPDLPHNIPVTNTETLDELCLENHASSNVDTVAVEESENDSDEEEDDIPWATCIFRPVGSHGMRKLLSRDANRIKHHSELVWGANKQPYWLQSIQAFSLDFSGRVTLPSNKNFQLVLEGDPAMPSEERVMDQHPPSRHEIHLQFGKVHSSADLEVYTLDLQWPLSPIQAFGIAISACVRKLAVA